MDTLILFGKVCEIPLKRTRKIKSDRTFFIFMGLDLLDIALYYMLVGQNRCPTLCHLNPENIYSELPVKNLCYVNFLKYKI